MKTWIIDHVIHFTHRRDARQGHQERAEHDDPGEDFPRDVVVGEETAEFVHQTGDNALKPTHL